jgi:hypothetical protein
MFAALARHLPPPAEYSSPPTLWGDPDHLRELLGGELESERRTIEFEADSPEDWFEFVAQSMGPFVSAREALDAQRWEALRDELVGLFSDANCATDVGRCTLRQEYLLAIVQL